MSNVVKQTKEDFIRDEMCDRERISKEEYRSIKDKTYTIVDPDDTLNEDYNYTRIIPEDFTKEQIDEFIAIRTYKMLRRVDKNINIIKNIAIFWLVLTCIGLMIYILSKFGH